MGGVLGQVEIAFSAHFDRHMEVRVTKQVDILGSELDGRRLDSDASELGDLNMARTDGGRLESCGCRLAPQRGLFPIRQMRCGTHRPTCHLGSA